MATVYKVTKTDWYGHNVSVVTTGEYKIVYRVGHVVRPAVGMIFAFRDSRSAIEWAKQLPCPVRVWECEAPDVKPLPYRATISVSCLIRSFWDTMTDRLPTPQGTVGVEWIKLVRVEC